MKILSVNASMGREINYMGKRPKTSTFKEPVKERVMLRQLNLEGWLAGIF